MSDRDLLLSFIASLTLCDHMGDVSNEIDTVLNRLGEIALVKACYEGDEFDGLMLALHKRGIKTLCGTEIGSDYDETT